jgi:opacity protein-like surface antigen
MHLNSTTNEVISCKNNIKFILVVLFLFSTTIICSTQQLHAQSKNPFHGFNFGISGGHISSTRSGTNSFKLEAIPYSIKTGSYNQSGNAFGVHLGYNHVLPSNLLLGVNISSYISDVQGEYVDSLMDGADQFTSEAWHRLESVTMAESRIGYAKNRWSVYGSLGYSISMARNDANFTRLLRFPTGTARLYGSWTDEEPQSAMTLGLGASYLIGDKISLGLDYDFIKVNGDVNSFSGAVGTFQTGSVPVNMLAVIKSEIHFAKLSISYRL